MLLQLCVAYVLLAIAKPAVAAETPHEYQIKAVFLYNFALFVEWPGDAFSNSTEPIVIGVLGKDPFGSYLEEAIAGEKVNNRSLVIARYSKVEEIRQCHILFISKSESPRLDTILMSLNRKPILTVADFEGFAQRGGMIRFTNENKKIRFRINVEATTAAHLTISSKLLRPANIISPGKD
jgi:hypothetical protein